MILVDTSVWIDHLRVTEITLARLLEQGAVCMHPLIIGELACGNLHNRAMLLKLWHSLFSIDTVTHDESLYFIEAQQLMGKGIGYIDVQLIASIALQSGTQFWTRDKRLAAVAKQLGLDFSEY